LSNHVIDRIETLICLCKVRHNTIVSDNKKSSSILPSLDQPSQQYRYS
jgi:hypothetical protein